jgi:metal-responsive CopG/Arc/MetJ family transcriptional regulator
MTEQTKRGPGRPPLKERAKVQDMHLNLPAGLLDEIDAVKGNRNRKQFILEAIREKLDRV